LRKSIQLLSGFAIEPRSWAVSWNLDPSAGLIASSFRRHRLVCTEH